MWCTSSDLSFVIVMFIITRLDCSVVYLEWLEFVRQVESSGQSLLAEGDDVRWERKVPVFMAPHLTCRSHTCLYLINDQVGIVLEKEKRILFFTSKMTKIKVSW